MLMSWVSKAADSFLYLLRMPRSFHLALLPAWRARWRTLECLVAVEAGPMPMSQFARMARSCLCLDHARHPLQVRFGLHHQRQSFWSSMQVEWNSYLCLQVHAQEKEGVQGPLLTSHPQVVSPLLLFCSPPALLLHRWEASTLHGCNWNQCAPSIDRPRVAVLFAASSSQVGDHPVAFRFLRLLVFGSSVLRLGL